MDKPRRIGVIIKYSDNVDEILIDYSISLDLNYVQSKPIKEWFEKSNSRVKWNGFLEEIRQKLRDNSVEIIFHFKGNEKRKKEFEKCLEKVGYPQTTADGLMPKEISDRNLELAKMYRIEKDLESTFTHLYIAADDGNDPESQFVIAEEYRKKYEGIPTEYPLHEDKNLENTAYEFYKRSAENKYIDAISKFYNSKLYCELSDEKSKLWHYSPLLLYTMYQDELLTGSYVYPEEA